MNKNIITGAIVVGTIATVGAIEANNNKVDAASTYTTTSNLNLRKTPSTSGAKLILMPKGSKVIPLQYSNGWVKVKYNSVYTGWCSAQYLTTKQVSNNNTNQNTGYKVSGVKYTTSALNLRSSASTTSNKIILMPSGAKVTTLAYSNGWYKVNYKGYVGWCSAQYLTSQQSSNNNQNTTVKKGIVANRMIIINQCTMRLAYYENGKLVTTFSCATGKASTATPNGKFSIIHKEVNRPYYKDHIPGGSPKNPLGYRFLQLTSSGYAIHGTNVPSSIGGKVSHGCVRLQNSNVEWLYDRVYVGTPVIIHSNPQGNKVVAAQYGYYIG